MASNPLPTVLVSNPPIGRGQSEILPYLYGILKTSVGRNPDLCGKFAWLPPDSEFRVDAETLLARHEDIEIAAFSTYLWNEGLNLATAAALKCRRPETLTIFGGPQLDHADPEIFKKYPQIDIVATGEAEIVFPRILRAYLEGNGYAEVPGILLNRGGERIVTAQPPKLDLERDFRSPYLELSEEMGERAVRQKYRAAFWETTRGCPFSCSYCDWGSYTMSRVRKVPEAILQAEIDWFAANRIDLLVVLDANFGMLPRDVEIARRLGEAKQRTGYPRSLIYLTSKNTVERNLELVRELKASGLLRRKLRFDIQSTDPEVLKNVSRENISLEKLRFQIQEAKAIAPMASSLILGLPGDNFEKSAKSLTDLFELGIHEDAIVILWSLLPNSPAADPAYIARHGIRFVARPLDHTFRDPEHSRIVGMDRVVVATNSYGPEDWIDMCAFAYFTRSLHCTGLTRYLALHERRCGTSYADFYKRLWTDFFVDSEEYRSVAARLRAFLDGDTTLKIEQEGKLYDLDEWLLGKYLEDIPAFYRALSRVFPNDEATIELFRFQRLAIASPDSEALEDARFDRDWPEYFGGSDALARSAGTVTYRFHRQRQRPRDFLGYVQRGFDHENRTNLHETDRMLARLERIDVNTIDLASRALAHGTPG